jgi:chemotaxis protein MotB
MFAISQVDSKKFMALKTGLSAGFGAPVAFVDGADQMLDPGGAVAPDNPNLAGAAGGKTRSAAQDTTVGVQPEKVVKLVEAMNKAQVAKEVESLKNAKEQIAAALQQAGLAKNAAFRFDERGLVITIATDRVLFTSGSADLQPQGRKLLDAIAPALLRLPNRISVDGHTNSIPISTQRFPSNWELSGDRATGVLRYLIRTYRIPPDRMSATGFADTHPLLPKDNPRALDVNRRVEIVVVARVDDSAGRAVAALGNQPEPAAEPAGGQSAEGESAEGEAAPAKEPAAEPATSGGHQAPSPAGVTGLGGIPNVSGVPGTDSGHETGKNSTH